MATNLYKEYKNVFYITMQRCASMSTPWGQVAWGTRPDADNIPQYLKDSCRWVAWIAQPFTNGEGKLKHSKRPINPHTGYFASFTNPAHWGSFDEAWTRYETGSPNGELSGVGIIVTGSGLDVGDLDQQLGDGTGNVTALADAAVLRAYGAAADTYIERSPSGKGLRIISIRNPETPREPNFINHKEGIDYFSTGYVTITGDIFQDRPIRPIDISGLLAHRPTRSETATAADMPELLDDADLSRPSSLPQKVLDFLDTGGHIGSADGNGSLLSAATHLYKAGLSDAEVLSMLAYSVGGQEVAGAEHRRPGSLEAQADWIWRYTLQKARKHAPDPIIEFEVLPPLGADRPPQADIEPPPGFLDLAQLDTKLAPPDWLIKPMVEKEQLGILYGTSGTRKSFVLIDWMMSVACKIKWQNRRTEHGVSVYICGEGMRGISKRVAAWQAQHADVKGPFYVRETAANLSTPEGIAEVAKGVRECYIHAQKVYGPTPLQCIGIDTLSANSGGLDENADSDMGPMMKSLGVIRDRFRCAVILVHHTGHGNKDRTRGSSTLLNNADWQILCQLDGEKDDKPLSRKTLLSSKKNKDGGAWGDVTLSARQHFFWDHCDADGEPMSTLILEEPANAAIEAAEDAEEHAKDAIVLEWVATNAGQTTRGCREKCGLPERQVRAAIDRLCSVGELMQAPQKTSQAKLLYTREGWKFLQDAEALG